MPSFWKERKQTPAEERRAREAVRKAGGGWCRVCGRRTRTVHEEKRRGAGGRVSLRNSYLACEPVDGGECHRLLQDRLIVAVRADGAEEFDAREPLVFEMTLRTAERAFLGRPWPAHIRIVEGE